MESKRSFWWWVGVSVVSGLILAALLHLAELLNPLGHMLGRGVVVPVWGLALGTILIVSVGILLWRGRQSAEIHFARVEEAREDPSREAPLSSPEADAALPAIGELSDAERRVLGHLIQLDGGRMLHDEFIHLIDRPQLRVESALEALEEMGYIDRISVLGGPTKYELSSQGRDRLIEQGEI